MIDWCADVLDAGSLGGSVESSMAKVAVSDALFRGCRSLRAGHGRHRRHCRTPWLSRCSAKSAPSAFMTGPTEVHKWSLAKKIKRDELKRTVAMSAAMSSAQEQNGRHHRRFAPPTGFDETRPRRLDVRQRSKTTPARCESSNSSGGQSNPTYKLTTPQPRLRAAPQTPRPPCSKGAHAVDREAKVLMRPGAAPASRWRTCPRPMHRRRRDRHLVLRHGHGGRPHLLGLPRSRKSNREDRPSLFRRDERKPSPRFHTH